MFYEKDKIMSDNKDNGIHARFNSGHIWGIIIGVFIIALVLIWRGDRAVNNGMFHIYSAINITNNNLKNLGTALQNHPATHDFKFEWVEIPPLHGKTE
ncbi:hypothetical protein AGMMS4952_00220 [Spirochaetia bacterium]|nr:hypothetical protein AGMMS4952_00220 [Spirochaetia bacterium]